MTPKKRRQKPILAFVENRLVELQRTNPSGIEHPDGGPHIGSVTEVTYPDAGGEARLDARAFPWRPSDTDEGVEPDEAPNPRGLPEYWTPELVKSWLGDAILTLMRLPAKGMRPAEISSAWPEWLRDADLAYGSEAVVVTQKLESNRRRPTILEIGRLDIALRWPFWIADVRHRIATVLVAMGKDLRTAGRKAGCSHETARVWSDKAFADIAALLNEGDLTKSGISDKKRANLW